MSTKFSNIIALQHKPRKTNSRTINLDSTFYDGATAIFVITSLNLSLNTLNPEIVVGEKTIYPKSSFEIIGSAEHIKKSALAVNFLNKHRIIGLDISLALIEHKIIDYFGNVPLYLELIDEERLSLFIGLPCTPEESLEKLYKFYDDWWIDKSYLVKGRLNIDVIPI